jgi:hypothetical protein
MMTATKALYLTLTSDKSLRGTFRSEWESLGMARARGLASALRIDCNTQGGATLVELDQAGSEFLQYHCWSIEEAFQQAKLKFGVRREDWRTLEHRC